MEQLKKTIILEYWLKKLSDEFPKIVLPSIGSISNKEKDSRFTSCHSFEFSEQTSTKMFEISKNSDISLFILALSGLNILLYNYTGIEDLVVGTVYPEKYGEGGELLFFRNHINSDWALKDLILQIGKEVQQSIKYGQYHFDELFNSLQLKTGSECVDIFSIAIILDEFQIIKSDYLNRFDFIIIVSVNDNRLNLKTKYNTEIYNDETVCHFCLNMMDFFSGLEEKILKRISDIEIINREEKEKILYVFNNTSVEYPKDKTIHELFRGQVARTPDKISVSGLCKKMKPLLPHTIKSHQSDMQLSYDTLDEQSDRLSYLLMEQGGGADTIVGIMIERSVEMIIGIMGILKANCAYLPIDLHYPEDRVAYILRDSQIKLLVNSINNKNSDTCGRWDGVNIFLEEVFESTKKLKYHLTLLSNSVQNTLTPATSSAYLLYTSGSTGKPKGVIIDHVSLVNRLFWMQRKYPINDNDTILHKTTYTFDVSIWEILWISIIGTKLHLLYPGGEREPEIITSEVERNFVTVMHFVPSLLNVFLDYVVENGYYQRLSSLKQVIASGEELTAQLVERFNNNLGEKNGTVLANLYGPTEATVDVSYFDCPKEAPTGSVPIGRPIDNIHLYILNKHSHIQPIGVSGEMCIAGIGLARGYLNRPELTAEKFRFIQAEWFLEKSFHTYKKCLSKGVCMNYSLQLTIYRTGDLGRWLFDGNIEFLGRIDHQVKIRGFRIELGEIENSLLRIDEIKKAIVVTKKKSLGEKYICAYFISTRKYEISKLRKHLSKELPDYMIPMFFVQIEEIPLSQNGKVDHNALPKPQLHSYENYVAPRSEIEKKLMEIWNQILNLSLNSNIQIGIDDNFFHLGGHSLNATIMVSKIHKSFGVKMELGYIFKNPTIRNIASLISTIQSATEALNEKGIEEEMVEVKI